MLKKRLLTALALIPLVVLLILYLPAIIFIPLSLVVFILAFTEWPRMVGYVNMPSAFELIKAGFSSFILFFGTAVLLLIMVALILRFLNLSQHLLDIIPPRPFWAAYISGLWCLPLIAVLMYPKGSAYYTQGRLGLCIGMILLFLAWCSLILLQANNPIFALYPLALVWMADSVAYFVGKGFGKTKLAPKVSPGKTWEGVLGAVIGGLILSYCAHLVLKIQFPLASWMLFNTVVVLFSVVGDLFESIFKRAHNLKDSGTLIPGHGGLLDRIDAQLAALPLFTAGYLIFNGFN